eukprot:CAMPEP_0195650306 /NCGR_PEP_ID=MMETSP0815-20121206/31645_1 /TAXON_ID=97485 /ORGANISM="Prymnesium parvum, Strain Texoma1" /LENGTH=77 /DNA_ID=CAMNT_0040794099 /DNA_START=406 /DNA_END=635 /DNA_ORIENTATION=-
MAHRAEVRSYIPLFPLRVLRRRLYRGKAPGTAWLLLALWAASLFLIDLLPWPPMAPLASTWRPSSQHTSSPILGALR